VRERPRWGDALTAVNKSRRLGAGHVIALHSKDTSHRVAEAQAVSRIRPAVRLNRCHGGFNLPRILKGFRKTHQKPCVEMQLRLEDAFVQTLTCRSRPRLRGRSVGNLVRETDSMFLENQREISVPNTYCINSYSQSQGENVQL
jgi:hypothetical protein